MTYLKYTLFVLCLWVVISCDNSVSENSEYQEEHKKAVTLAYKAITNGDTLAYDKAAQWFILSKEPSELFFYSNTMALRYNYCMAYYHNYFIMDYFQYVTKSSCDSSSFYYMLYNISKMYELGCNEDKMKVCGVEFTEKSIKSSNYYHNKITERR
jgi:hypothetical protein